MLSKFPTSIKEKIVHNVQSSSENQYQVLWKRFAEFVFKRYKGKFPQLVIFHYFNHLISCNFSYTSLLCVRSALQRLLKYHFPNWSLKYDDELSLLLNYAKTHKKPKVDIACWYLDKVLFMLMNPPVTVMNNAEFILKKFLFLTVLANPLRISEFQAITISKNTFNNDYIILRPHQKFIAKNYTNNNCPYDLVIPTFPSNKRICPVKNLMEDLKLR